MLSLGQDTRTKVLVLGLELMNAVGPDALEAAVQTLKVSEPPNSNE